MLSQYLLFAYEILSGKRTRSEAGVLKRRQDELLPYIDLGSPAIILDLANGRLRPQSYLLAKQGHLVVGLDYVNDTKKSFVNFCYSICRAIFRFQAGLNPFQDTYVNLIQGDAGRIPLADSSVDFVSSAAAFEHFLDVPKVVQEISRVTKKDGIVWAYIHIFTSLSGGHDFYSGLGTITSLPLNIKPWSHLLDPNWKACVPLNRLRVKDYVDIFSKHFEILKLDYIPECNPMFLTEELKTKLSEYSIEELTNTIIITARRT